jgi:RND family efflux transporter MFP subunit
LIRPHLLLAAAVLAIGAHPAATAETARTPVLGVSTEHPQTSTLPETVPASGWLRPWQEAAIASEISGLTIKSIHADVGSEVKKGQVLAQLDQQSVMAAMKKQAATVDVAKANLKKAHADADRARQLRPTGAISNESYVEAIANEETAQANIAVEEAALDSQRIQFAQTTITAIDDGVVTSRSGDLGAVVSAGTELFRIIRQNRVEWQAEVSARHLADISPGMRVWIDGLADQPAQGRVRLVAPSVNADTGRAIVYVELPASVKPRPGTYVAGRIELKVSTALTVPETAVIYRDGMTYAFVVEQNDHVRRVKIETGRRAEGKVEVTSGLTVDEDVVVSGGAFLSDKDAVTVTGAVR